MSKPSVSSARAAQAGANVRRTARPIDFSDIPEASTGQLKAMRRVGRPPLGDRTRQVIAIRVDAGVLDNQVLAEHARKDVA